MTIKTTSALERVVELQDAVLEAEYQLQDLRNQEEIALMEPAACRKRLREYHDQVAADPSKADLKVENKLKVALRNAEDEIVSTGKTSMGKPVIESPRIQAQIRHAQATILRPAQIALNRFVQDHREEIVKEKMLESVAAYERVQAAQRELGLALDHHQNVYSSWQPFVRRWNPKSTSSGGFADLPPWQDGTLSSTGGLKVPMPSSLRRLSTKELGLPDDFFEDGE